jgi:hypothetical protein
MKYFKVIETAYLNGKLCQPGEVVALPDETKRVGECLIPCDEDGKEVTRKRGKQPDASAVDIG